MHRSFSVTVPLTCLILCALVSLCAAAQCNTGSLPFSVHFEKEPTEWVHYWERCVGSGHATLALRQDWRDQLTRVHHDAGFQQVRFHGLFDDDMSVFLDGGYSFFNVDSIFDFLLSIGMKPLVELSFMPADLASGNSTIFHYKGNITPPKKWTMWADLITAFAKHCIDRYGADEVHTWHFETWNEPNCGFWTSTQEDYFRLLQVTSAALKAVDPKLSVGGPATCQSQWLNETIAFCEKNNVAIDFISTHEYPTDKPPLKRGILKGIMQQAREEVGDRPLFYTEYNDGLFGNPPLHDTIYASAFAVFNVIDLYGIPDLLSWWTFTDVFEEQGFISIPFNGGFGMQTAYGIPKPSYRAFQLLHSTGDKRVSVDDFSYPTAGILVTKNSTHAHILAYNHNIPDSPINDEELCIQMTGLNPSKTYVGKIQRIDEAHANPVRKWVAMGSPGYLDKGQVDTLMKESEMVLDTIHSTVVGSQVVFTISVPKEGVAAITFEL